MPKYLKFAFFAAIFFVLLSFNVCAITVIDNMDDVSLWTGTGLIQETTNIKEGTGAVRIDSSSLLQFNRVFKTPMDLSAYEDDGVVSVWIYFEDVSVFPERDNSMEFTSSGTCDVEESGFSLDNYLFENGWNHLVVGLDEFASYDADWTRINYIRFYKFTDGQNTMIVDDLKIGTKAEFGIGTVRMKDTATLFESFDSAEGFTPQTIETSRHIEGTGAIVSTSDSEMNISKVYATPVDMSRMADFGHAYLWIYIEDPTLLKDGGSIEITSSGGYDVEETSWPLDSNTGLKAGWNELLLDVSKATQNECDFSRINYIRVFAFTNGANTMMLDKMYLGVGQDFGVKPPETEPPETEPEVTEAPAAGDTTADAGDTTKAPAAGGSSNTVLYIIIGAAAVVVLIIIIVVAATSKKKK